MIVQCTPRGPVCSESPGRKPWEPFLDLGAGWWSGWELSGTDGCLTGVTWADSDGGLRRET